MLELPWLVAPRDLAAGDVIVLGRDVADGTIRPPMVCDVSLVIGEDVIAGTLLGVGDDGRLHPLLAKTDQTAKPERKPTRASAQSAARRAATGARPARRTGNG